MALQQLNAVLNDFEGDKDQANLRVVALPDGTEVKINRTDPYGLMQIEFQGKETPETLTGAYTTYHQARQALEAHWINRPQPKKKK